MISLVYLFLESFYFYFWDSWAELFYAYVATFSDFVVDVGGDWATSCLLADVRTKVSSLSTTSLVSSEGVAL